MRFPDGVLLRAARASPHSNASVQRAVVSSQRGEKKRPLGPHSGHVAFSSQVTAHRPEMAMTTPGLQSRGRCEGRARTMAQEGQREEFLPHMCKGTPTKASGHQASGQRPCRSSGQQGARPEP